MKNLNFFQTIQSKLISLIIVVICIPFFLMGLIWYEKSTSEIKQNAIISNTQLVQQINGELDNYFLTLENTTYPLLIHPDVITFLSIDRSQNYERYVITKKIQDELLSTLTFSRPDIYSIAIISSNNIHLSQRGGYSNLELFNKYNQTLPNDKNYKIVDITIEDTLPVITILRRFTDSNTYISKGILVVQLRLNDIVNILNRVPLGNSGFIWLINESGQIVYHPNKELIGTNASTDTLQLFNNGNGYIEMNNQLYVYSRSDKTQWTMISEVPIEELMTATNIVRNFSMYAISIIVISALIFITAFTIYISKSIRILQSLMYKAEQGNFEIEAPAHSNDEFGRLNHSFNHMVSNIKRLMQQVKAAQQKEKELEVRSINSELEALHAQINPHFLYNTLEIINSQAILADQYEISHMTTNLADIFRFSISDLNEKVTLQEELEHTVRYLEIQKQRFPSINIEIEAPPSLLSHYFALRLILQPIIENCFIHGYEKHKLKPTYIGISIKQTSENDCQIIVSDFGGGMPPNKLIQYNTSFKEAEIATPSTNKKSIGIWNVHRRIRLSFGYPYGLQILHSDSSGTKIQILLPYSEMR